MRRLVLPRRLTVPVWRRPWVGDSVRREGGWPVEYRAIVHNGRLTAITSYYVQRALARNDQEIETVAVLTRRLAAAASGPYEWEAREDERLRVRKLMPSLLDKQPADDERPDPELLQATVDFVSTSSGMLMLEGGPPPWAGGHPCCFEGVAGRPQGVRLSRTADPWPLP